MSPCRQTFLKTILFLQSAGREPQEPLGVSLIPVLSIQSPDNIPQPSVRPSLRPLPSGFRELYACVLFQLLLSGVALATSPLWALLSGAHETGFLPVPAS